MSLDADLDLSQPHERAILLRAINSARGICHVVVKRRRNPRSNAQNRLYWMYIHTFRMHLAEQGDVWSDDALHEMLKGRFLMVNAVDPLTGEHLGFRMRSTTELDVEEFNQFLSAVHHYLNETYGVQLPEREEFAPDGGGTIRVQSVRVGAMKLLPAKVA